ncbi:MAG: methyltransferase domain-containing protein [Candidatus Electryoneaceae bacterium]|nr:methyltransferase domain-containing protein [Candidatus Electryoneaceae bacterium]
MRRLLKSFLQTIIPDSYHDKLKRSFYTCLYSTSSDSGLNCPFCGGTFRKFLPSGFHYPVLREKNVVSGGYRLNAQCPKCGSLDRERLVYQYLLKKTDFFSRNVRLLHVAPEEHLEKCFRRHPNIDYLTADLYAMNVMVKMDISDIHYDDNSFDVIICNHVLEHVLDDRKAMAELFRVLKPDGWAILQVPISLLLDRTFEDPTVTTSEERERIFGQDDHVRIYAGDYSDRLEEVGFRVEQFRWTEDSAEFGGSGNRYGLIKDEILYIVFKKEQCT